MGSWSFAIISDIHVFSSGAVPSAFASVVQQIAAEKPRFVVMAGDATVGNLPIGGLKLFKRDTGDTLLACPANIDKDALVALHAVVEWAWKHTVARS